MEIFKASNQWQNRPSDERFWNMEELAAHTRYVKDRAVTAEARLADLRVVADGTSMLVVGKQNKHAQLSHYAFGQLAARVGAPVAYLRDLPATLAAQNLNHGLKAAADADGGTKPDSSLLFHNNGDFVLRAVTSMKYSRIWNDTLVRKVASLIPEGWRVPPARPTGKPGERTRIATQADVLRSTTQLGGGSVKVGDTIAPAGLYASDKDVFMFLVREDAMIDDGTDSGLMEGLMLWNSEVGDASFGGMKFMFKGPCSNHICWGAEDVFEFSHRHVGNVEDRAKQSMELFVRKYANSSMSDRAPQIEKARKMILGATKDEVLDAVLAFVKAKKLPLTKKLVAAGYDLAVQHEDWYGNPHSVYGMVNGLTEASQVDTHADERFDIDRAAGKVMTMAF